MKGLFSKAVKLFGITLMMAIITTPGLKWTTSQAFKDKYHNKALALAKELENQVDNLQKNLK
ncbi:hypothetical protein CR3_gp047 [Cronobacter phage CR3]|uniref:Uncharacterized protein n=3 Tax=Certrevirus TaxID=1914850 RepID=I1TR89_9CAUD|nr:hypothetical protein CR3_gp047 [Cronobacter phage CR3]YP_009042286.1 hypothetical protein HL10_gp049 [Cronobacter phage CR8]YP_009189018.1 hypothetical protein ADU18_0157 [Cronobacter phage PBES 02]AFH21212.1 hypothetical protein CR3_047 [Cronobacter phage CR3]AIA64579.1 hypothetical protein CR8_049 [Cronobacter phage CR8]AKY04057.1 hypothetical protein ADU18_0157 [Cronobacter phage PBES 02]